MMKKNLLWTLAAALALVGCSQDELLNDGGLQEGGDAIAFSSYLGSSAQGRATEVTTETLGQEGFGVNAWYTMDKKITDEGVTKEAFMTDTKVTYNEDKAAWTYSPLKYWPNNKDHMVSFFAYGPYDLPTSSSFNDDKTAINFTVESDVKSQVDLIYNTNYTTIDMKKPAVNTRINFTFDHALSRISFSVEAAVDVVESNKDDSKKLDGNTVINVKRVALVNASVNDGEYEYTEGDAGPFYTSGTLSLLKPANDGDSPWTIETPDNTQGFVLDGDNFYRTIELTDGSEVVQLHKFNQKQPLTNEESYLMVIPQNLLTSADGGTSDGFKIYIEYDVITEGEDGDSSTITNHIVSKDAMSVDFKQGMAYNFNLVLGMTSVQFGASVTDWGDATDYEEWLPENSDGEDELVATNLVYNPAQYSILIRNAADLVEARNLINERAPYLVKNDETDDEGNSKVYKVVPAGSRAADNDEYQYFYSAYYYQVGDVDLSGEENWKPIGLSYDEPFNGIYKVSTDGSHPFTISNLTITSAEGSYASLFGCINSSARIENLTIKDVNIGTEGNPVSATYAAAIVAECYGSVNNCKVESGNIYGQQVAGLVAYGNNAHCTGCKNEATVYGTGNAAGIYAGNEGLINDCENTGEVTSTGSYAAGITIYTNVITFAKNSGDITGKEDTGGIVACQMNTGSKVVASYNTGNIISTDKYAGGIAGSSYGIEFTACYNNAEKIGGKQHSGGIVGLWSIGTSSESLNATLTSCYSTTGEITKTEDDAYAGALCGKVVVRTDQTYTHSVTYKACYYANYEGSAIGNDSGATDVTLVDDSNTTWTTAVEAMNAELTSWAYSLNEDNVPTIAPKTE